MTGSALQDQKEKTMTTEQSPKIWWANFRCFSCEKNLDAWKKKNLIKSIITDNNDISAAEESSSSAAAANEVDNHSSICNLQFYPLFLIFFPLPTLYIYAFVYSLSLSFSFSHTHTYMYEFKFQLMNREYTLWSKLNTSQLLLPKKFNRSNFYNFQIYIYKMICWKK